MTDADALNKLVEYIEETAAMSRGIPEHMERCAQAMQYVTAARTNLWHIDEGMLRAGVPFRASSKQAE